VIGEPLNDEACLGLVSERAMAMTESGDVRNLAGEHRSSRSLARWIRRLPQRNDAGDPGDGPRIPCDVSQRLRIPADDPNCVERSALYLAAGELIDPRPLRQLATIETPAGRHTFPVENGVPVVLDPLVPRNALEAGLFQLLEPSDLRNLPATDALGWLLSMAEEPARRVRNGGARLRNAERAMAAVLRRRPLPRNGAEDLGFALAMASEVAPMFGAEGLDLLRVGATALNHVVSRRVRNALRFQIGGLTIRPDLDKLAAIGRVGARVGIAVGTEAVKAKLATLGIGPDVISAVESELGREGLTLGALAGPPPQSGTLAALTTSALLQRRLS